MKTLISTFALCAAFVQVSAQQVYELTAPAHPKEIVSGHLKMGGESPSGGRIAVNSYYMSVDGRPTIPVMGEFHYSRYPKAQWEEEIMKMKAGGVNVIPTYVFWSLHEEKEGVFKWSDNLDVRYFIELCKKHQMSVIVRIGPFCHGEIRSGALPDWLFAKPIEVRSNDEPYLFYVKRLYGEIAKQLKGLYYKDGGPIIGTQIENEHQHSAAPWAICYPGEPKDMTTATYDQSTAKIGVSVQDKAISNAESGNLHMRTLKKMAEEAGILTPLYTATGWGNAAVIGNEALPVTSAYTYPFWAAPHQSPFCLFKDIQKHPDYEPVRYDAEQFPSFCAEMGVGIQMIYGRRPVVTAEAAEALMVRSLGSGANGIGYYMYHGGSTPKMEGGTGFFADEPMGMPKISYDFQAPLGEFGLEHSSYRHLRLIHSFLSDFSDRLAPMEVVLPKGYDQLTPANRETLRFAARMKDNSGFIFMVNFQDHDTGRVDQKELQLRLNLKGSTLLLPSKSNFTLPKDESVILPFNFKMGDCVLTYAMAQPLMKVMDKGVEHYFFFAPKGMTPEYQFETTTVKGKSFFTPSVGLNSTFTVKAKSGKVVKVTTLTRQQALNSSKVNGHLLITEVTTLPEKNTVKLLSLGNPTFNYVLYPSKQGFKSQTVQAEPVTPVFDYNKKGSRHLSFHFASGQSMPQVNEYFLRLNYTGDVAMAFMGGELVQDHFYYGAPWTIGLNRYASRLAKEDMNFYIRPLRANAPFLKDLPADAVPVFTNGQALSVNKVEVIPEYTVTINNIE